MKFLIKFPTRSRPSKFFDTLDKYISKFSSKNEYKILVSCDIDDQTMNNKEIVTRLNSYSNLEYFFSKRTTKIGAINRDINKINYDWDVLISAADDMIPIIDNYDCKIQEEMMKNYPDTDGALWFFDGATKDINTQSIIGRKYYDRFGWIYYPGYKTWFCDGEYTFYAKSINKLTYIEECIITHEHPGHRPGNTWDQLYIENDQKEKTDHDHRLFLARQKINFNPYINLESV